MNENKYSEGDKEEVTEETPGNKQSAERAGEKNILETTSAAEPTVESQSAKHSKVRIIIPVVLVLCVAGGLLWFFLLREPAVPANLIEVSGRIESDDASVSAKTSGRIREIAVREGDTVKAGQIVALLDDEQLKAREEQAQAAVTQTEIRIVRAQQQIAVLEEQLNQSQLGIEQSRLDAQGRVSQAQAQIAQAEAGLAQAEANYKQAKYDEEKFGRLFKTGDVSERQTKQAITNAEAQAEIVRAQRKQIESARGSLTVARANLANPAIRTAQTSTIQKQIAQAESDINSANADAERARAQLREAQANRQDLTIIAPFDATVATRAAEPGEVVSPGTAIITLVNFNAVYLRAFVPEGEIGRVRVGQAARVYLDSNPNRPLEGEVARIDPEAAFTPENTYYRDDRVKQVVGVKLIIKNAQGYAKPGMPADGEILIEGEWATSGRNIK